MKKETYANKLAALLGGELTKFAPKSGGSVKKAKNYNRPVEISEDEIAEFRAVQGVLYFLQAPELFSPKVCPHCGEHFLVSRQFVQFCSYTCIRLDLESKGLSWKKGENIEALIKDPDVYDGQEPIWIKNLDRLRKILDERNFKESLLSQARTSPQESSTEPRTVLSVAPQTT